MRGLSLGLGAAFAALGAIHMEPLSPRPAVPRMGWPWDDEGQYIPNDHGPVIDTTPESKRARRRRLARQSAAS